MEKKKIFNPKGDDAPENRLLIGGNTTNLMQLNRVRYRWAIPLYKRMLNNFWIPEKTDLTADFSSFERLSFSESKAYRGILSFLTFLDSIQTTNIPNIAAWVTAPEVVLCLTTHAFQEAVHSQSYQYMVETLLPSSERDELYDLWRYDETLYRRNRYIASIYQTFLDEQNETNFHRVLVANYILEGLYFVNGFYFFYNLAARGLMLRTMEVIKYIHRDEMTHMALFQSIIREILPPSQLAPIMVPLVEKAVQQEIYWSCHIMEGVSGVSPQSITQFTMYLANQRLRQVGLEPLYEGAKNPYEHLDKYSNVGSESTVMGNFFEATVTEYQMSSTLDGWNDF